MNIRESKKQSELNTGSLCCCQKGDSLYSLNLTIILLLEMPVHELHVSSLDPDISMCSTFGKKSNMIMNDILEKRGEPSAKGSVNMDYPNGR